MGRGVEHHTRMGAIVSTPTVTRPAAPPARARRFAELNELARTTPGVLAGLMVALVLVSALAGVFTALGVQSRSDALDDLSTRSGPLSVAAQQIYRSLSDADATATGAFLSGGREPAEQRTRYQDDIAQAETAIAVAVAAHEPADVTRAGSPLATLTAQLSVYTGLVETARANNLQGLPVGAAYQREASNLMRSTLLPAAAELYRAEAAQVAADQDSAAAVPVLEIACGVLALGALFFAQRHLRRSTNRVFNVGLLVATAATLVSLLWVLFATLGVVANVSASRENGSTQTDVLARARIATLAARADETLTLVARGSGTRFEQHYGKVRLELAGADGTGGLLAEARALATDDVVRAEVDSAAEHQRAWHQVHLAIRGEDDAGRYPEAVQLATGRADTGAAALADRVDDDLRAAIARTTATFEDEVRQAGNALTGAVLGVVLLAVVAAVGAVVGIWQRLKEYR